MAVFMKKYSRSVLEKHYGFLNHQNKLSFVAPDNGMQTRIQLLAPIYII